MKKSCCDFLARGGWCKKGVKPSYLQKCTYLGTKKFFFPQYPKVLPRLQLTKQSFISGKGSFCFFFLKKTH